jgi:hypothetical protein
MPKMGPTTSPTVREYDSCEATLTHLATHRSYTHRYPTKAGTSSSSFYIDPVFSEEATTKEDITVAKM